MTRSYSRKRHSSRPAPPPEGVRLFNATARPVLAQQIYPFEHDRLGRFDLFIVPVGQDAQGLAYEAVFNRLIDEPARG